MDEWRLGGPTAGWNPIPKGLPRAIPPEQEGYLDPGVWEGETPSHLRIWHLLHPPPSPLHSLNFPEPGFWPYSHSKRSWPRVNKLGHWGSWKVAGQASPQRNFNKSRLELFFSTTVTLPSETNNSHMKAQHFVCDDPSTQSHSPIGQ